MTVADLAHEAARRCVDAVLLAYWARVAIERLGRPRLLQTRHSSTIS